LVPIEVLKIRAQNNRSRKLLSYRGLFRGFWPTFWRDVPPLGIYFYTYEYLKSRLRGTEKTDKFSSRLLSGGVAGTVCWLVAFPMDVIKTRMMVSQDKHSIA